MNNVRTKIIKIDTPTCQEVALFMTQDAKGNTKVLIQAWHYFEDEWFYQSCNIEAEWRILEERFLLDFTVESAIAFVSDFSFTNQ